MDATSLSQSQQHGGGDQFGTSVAVSGETLVVGAYGEASSTTGVNTIPNEGAPGSGAAYVFVRIGGAWTQQTYLKAGNTGVNDSFGFSVAVSGETLVVGARSEASSTTGVNSTPNEGLGNSGAAYIHYSTALPMIVSAGTLTGTPLQPFTYTITAVNSPTSYGAANLPTGLSLNTTTGVISGTPPTSSTNSVTLSAINNFGTWNQTITLSVRPPTPVITSAAAATATAGQSFTYNIIASNSPTSYGAGNLPTGLSLDVTTGVISGTPTTAGTPAITLSASNDGGTATQTFTLTVKPQIPVITSAATATTSVGQSFTYNITASNLPTSYGAANLPAGLSLNTTTGVISGTPTTSSTYLITLSASNDGSTGSLTFTLTVKPQIPVITSAATATTSVGQSFTYTITAINEPTSYGAANLPAGLSLNTTTGMISGTPTTAGTYAITISATNAEGTGTQTLTLTVKPHIPEITSAATIQGAVGQSFSYSITATESPTSFGAANLPAGLSLDPTTGVISGTPTTAGTYTIKLSASNAGGTSAAPTGTVVAWGSNGSGQTTVPAGLTGVTAISGGDYHTVALKSDGTVVAWGYNGYGQTTVPAGLTGVTAIAGGYYHTVALKSDGTGIATLVIGKAQQTIEFADIGDTLFPADPIALSASASSGLGVTFSVVSGPATVSGSTLTLTGVGTVTVMASQAGDKNYLAASVNPTRTFTVKSKAPVITSNNTASGTVGQSLTYTITATHLPTAYGATGLPTGLSLNTTSGVISGTPATFGTNTVTLSASNDGGTATQTLTLGVKSPIPVITSAGTISAHVGLAFTNGITANNKPTSFGATGLPTGLSFNTTTGVISGTPTTTGAYIITLSASNDGGTGNQTLTLTVKPHIPLQALQAYLKAGNTGAGDFFGMSVAVSGDTAVVGAYGEDSSTKGVNSTPNESATDSGAAYVFVRSGTNWIQQAFLKASNTGAQDAFGVSVAVSGDTVAVGARGESSSTKGVNSTPNEGATGSGAAYVFVRNGTTRTQQAYLKASNAGKDDWFGRSVAVSGDTLVVGAPYEDSSTKGVNSTADEGALNSGAAYVFARSGTNWMQRAYLKASNTGVSDLFGTSVGVSGDTAIVGAIGEDSNTKGVNSTANEGALDSGAAYVFVQSGTNWTQQAYLKASNTGAQDAFGVSVAVWEDRAVVGARGESSSTMGVNTISNESALNSGAAYVFVRSGTTWTQQAFLKAGNTGKNDMFGSSVAVSGDTVVSGGHGEDSSTKGVNTVSNESAVDSGAAYFYAPSLTAGASGDTTPGGVPQLLGRTFTARSLPTSKGDSNDGGPESEMLTLPVTPMKLTITYDDMVNGFALHLQGDTTHENVIEYSTDLLNWTPIGTKAVGESELNLIDPQEANTTYRFYRVIKK